MPTAAEIAFIEAISSGQTPESIQAYAAQQAKIPADVRANPSAYGYDYPGDPAGLVPQRNLAFADSSSYDYRNDPSWMALSRNLDASETDITDRAAHDLGTLDVLQPVTEDDILANQEQALRRVDSSAEARGIFQSGERLLNRADTTGDYQRQLAGVQLSGGIQRGNIQFDAQQQQKELARRRQDALTQYATPPLPSTPNVS